MQAFATAVSQPEFWLSVVQIIWINILLSGDNAVVIALACRALPRRERIWGMVIGAGVASILLIAFTGVVSALMTLPYVRLVGAVALVWIAVRLLAPQVHEREGTSEVVQGFWRAVRIVVLADIIMSLDNVIAVAAVAKGRYVLLAVGLVVSIPMVIAGSAIILALLERFPILVWGGAGILGWVAGDICASDPIVEGLIGGSSAGDVELAIKIAGALAVVGIGALWRYARKAAASDV